MKLTRESQYGLEGLRVLARQPKGTVMLLGDIAEAGRLPSRFLSQIFQRLRRHNVVSSHRGTVRGYSLARPAHQITLREVFEAIEGSDFFERCVFWPEQCADTHPCCLHGRWAAMREKLKEMLEGTTLEDLVAVEDLFA
jgi:Rrf2 family protein